MKVMAILMAFFSLNVMASDAEVSLDPDKFDASTPLVETKFAADRELGRAWIVLTVRDRIEKENDYTTRESVKVRVDGLAYDPASGNITYEGPNQQKTVCAEQRRFLASRFFKNTRDCRINVAFDTRKVDDGFSLKEERVANIVLDVARR